MHSFLRVAGLVCWLSASRLAAEENIDAAPGWLRLPVDRRVVLQLETAAKDLADQEVSRALPVLEQLWLQSGRRLYSHESRWETVEHRIRELIRQLPEAEQRQFWRRIEVAKEGAAALSALPTRSGLRALLSRAADFRDQGEFELAAAAYAAAARHPAATPAEASLIRVLQWEMQAALEGPAAMTVWLKSQDPRALSRPLTVLGTPKTVETWLTEIHSLAAVHAASPRDPLDRPALDPVWNRDDLVNEELREDLEPSLEELRRQGMLRLPTAVPALVGTRIVTRAPWGLMCLSAETGETLWFAEDRPTAGRSLPAMHEQRRTLQPRVFAKLMFSLLERLQVNTLLGSLSHDEQTIYHVVPSPSSTSNPNPPPVTRCALEAVDAATGETLWKISEPKTPDDLWWQSLQQTFPALPATEAAEFSICGPPAVVGSRLYFLATLSSELVFCAVDKHSRQLAWATEIGHILPNFGRLTFRGQTGCRPIWTGELLICPTACGLIVAIDPIQERPRWFTRIPVAGPSRSSPGADAAASAAMELALRAWREATIVRSAGKLVCISPESQAVHCLEEATGKILCSIPREDGLTLIGSRGDCVYVLEPTAIRAHELSTGAMIWRNVIGEIRGRGALVDQHAVQPLADGSLAVVDLETGRRSPGRIGSEMTFGNLIPLNDGWLSVDELQVCRLPDLAKKRGSPAKNDVDDEFAAQERNLDGGDFAAVRDYAATHPDDRAQNLLRKADLAELRFAPDRGWDFRERLLQLSTSKTAQGEALRALGEAALAVGEFREAMGYALDGLALELTGEIDLREESVRRVRWDRAFQGIAQAALRAADPEQRRACEEQIIERWHAAGNSQDPFAPQQLYQHLRALPAARRQLLKHPEPVFLGSGQLVRELSLLEAGGADDDATRIEAAFCLGREWRDAGFRQQGDDVEFALLRDAPGARAESGLTVRRRLIADGSDVDKLLRRMNQGPEDRWPRVVPKAASESQEVLDASHRTVIPLETDGNDLWDRLEVSVDRYARRLYFSGAGQSDLWSVELPKASTGVHPYTFRGWTVGHLLIVRIGVLLAAVSPFDDQGAPQAKLLWSQDLLGMTSLLPDQFLVERIPVRWKQVEDEFRVIDGFHRDFGRVGSLCPEFLCYLQQGRLTAVETLTGRLLWERWDVLPGTIAWGDHEQILLWNPDRETLEILAASDGRTIARRICRLSPEEIWHESAGIVWTGRVGEELTMECRNLMTDRLVWQCGFPRESQPVRLDHRTGAVVDPRGLLHLFHLLSGEPVGEALTIDVPQPLERLAVHRDETRWYLSLSGSVGSVFDWQSTQPYLGYRRPIMRGPLYAIDRASGQIAWRRDHAGEPWLLDQPLAAPVLIQVFKQPPPTPGQGIGEGVLRVFDKRTGEELLTHRDINLVPFVAVEADADLKRVELKMERLVLQLDYDPPAP